MARRHPVLRRLAILAGIGVALLGVSALVGFARRHAWLGHAVGVAEIHGVIGDDPELLATLDDFRTAAGIVAVVLRIDSPGGAVAPSQEITDAVWRLRERKPVVASLGNVAASGGYYVASAANAIVADPGTLTGSIGVIMEFRNFQGLADKAGVSESVVKSGRFKDIGHPLRPMTDDERALLQAVVDDVEGQFVDAVARGRGMDAARVRAVADGRIFSGAQAKAAGLVDELGGYDTALKLAWTKAGETGEPREERHHARHWPWWMDVFNEAFAPSPRSLGGGLLFLYRGSDLQ
jgi:protease-4